MPTNIGIYNGSPTAAGTDGTLIGSGNPIADGDLTTGADATGAPVKLASRVITAGYKRAGTFTIELVGTTADRWSLAPDSGGAPGTWGAWGASLTLAGPIVPTNVIFWARPRVTSAEVTAGDDTTVSLRTPDDVTSGAPVGKSIALPYVVGVVSSVGKSVALPYSVKNAVGKSVALPYSVKNAVGKSITLPYSIMPVVSTNRLLDLRASKSDGSAPRADGNTSATWVDLSGNGYNASLAAGTWKGDGSSGSPYVLRFADGEGGTFGDIAAFDLDKAGAFTVEFWVKSSTGSNTPGIIDKWLSGTGGVAVHLNFNANLGKPRLTIGQPANNFDADLSVIDGSFHHCVVTHDGTTAKWYIDGTLRVTSTFALANTRDSNAATLSGDGVSSQKRAMDLGQLRIYSRALTAGEVTQNYTAGVWA